MKGTVRGVDNLLSTNYLLSNTRPDRLGAANSPAMRLIGLRQSHIHAFSHKIAQNRELAKGSAAAKSSWSRGRLGIGSNKKKKGTETGSRGLLGWWVN